METVGGNIRLPLRPSLTSINYWFCIGHQTASKCSGIYYTYLEQTTVSYRSTKWCFNFAKYVENTENVWNDYIRKVASRIHILHVSLAVIRASFFLHHRLQRCTDIILFFELLVKRFAMLRSKKINRSLSPNHNVGSFAIENVFDPTLRLH